MFDPDPSIMKEKDPVPAAPMIETEVISVEAELVTPEAESIYEESEQKEQKLDALEIRIDAMLDRIKVMESESRLLKNRVASLGNQVVALEDKVARKYAPTLHSIVLDEIHRIIFATQTVIFGYMNAYIVGPVQKLNF